MTKLSLVEVPFDEQSIKLLAEYVRKSRYLKELDISSNRCLPHNLMPLLEALADNTKLRSLSMAFNCLTEG